MLDTLSDTARTTTRPTAGPTRPATGPAARPATGPDGALAGREREHALLAEAVEQAAAGTTRLVEVTGEPGIGKSRLLAEVAALAGRRGMPAVLAGAAATATGGLAALARAFEDHLAAAGPGAGDGIRREHHTQLATLLRAPARPVAGPSPDPARQSPGAAGPLRSAPGPDAPDELTLRRQLTAVRSLLTALAAPRGLVVVLDDLHRADPALIALLRHLVTRPPRAALLLVFGYRDRQAPIALTSAMRDAPLLTRLPLGPLAHGACADLVPALVAPTWRRALLAAGDGNPLYLRALSVSARPGPPDTDGIDLDPLPPALLAPLVAELDTLSPEARLAAYAAAVLGGSFEPSTVAFVADLAHASRYLVFDELSRRDVVRPRAGTGDFVFRHLVLRHAVYQSTDPGWRLGAHARAAEVLRRRHAPAEALAPHLLRVADPGDLEAAGTVAEAAVAIRDRVPGTAVAWLQAACRLVPDRPDTRDRRAELLFELGRALDAAGRASAARDTLQEALLLDPRMTAGRLRAVSSCARLERRLGHAAQGRAMLRRELEGAAVPDDAYRAGLLVELAGDDLLDGRLERALTGADQALSVARLAGVRPLAATASGVRAMAYCLGGDIPEGNANLAVATSLLDGLLDRELATHLDAAVWIGWSEIILERPWDALRHVVRALRAGRGSGQHAALTWLLAARVVVLRGLGRLPEATASAAEAVELAIASGDAALRIFAEVLETWVAVWTGEMPAQRPGRGAAGADRSAVDLTAIGWFGVLHRAMRVEVVASGADPAGDGDGDGDDNGDDNRGCRGRLIATADVAEMDPWSRVALLEQQARAALEAGRVDLADSWGVAAQAGADRLGLPGRGGLAQLARAHALTVQDPRAAVAAATTAATELAAAGLVVDARRASVVAAQALAACGHAELAQREVSSAQQYFEQCGAARLARDAGRLRVRLAARGRPAGRRQDVSGPQSLTAREQQVAGLVGDGLTNREIARRLHVKEKTVEMHLTRIFAKLGVTNRVGVVRMVLRLADPPGAGG